MYTFFLADPVYIYIYIYIFGSTTSSGPGLPHFGGSKVTLTHHDRQNSSRRVISPTHSPLPDNTQHSKELSMPSPAYEPTMAAAKRPQIHALDRADYIYIYYINITSRDNNI